SKRCTLRSRGGPLRQLRDAREGARGGRERSGRRGGATDDRVLRVPARCRGARSRPLARRVIPCEGRPAYRLPCPAGAGTGAPQRAATAAEQQGACPAGDGERALVRDARASRRVLWLRGEL